MRSAGSSKGDNALAGAAHASASRVGSSGKVWVLPLSTLPKLGDEISMPAGSGETVTMACCCSEGACVTVCEDMVQVVGQSGPDTAGTPRATAPMPKLNSAVPASVVAEVSASFMAAIAAVGLAWLDGLVDAVPHLDVALAALVALAAAFQVAALAMLALLVVGCFPLQLGGWLHLRAHDAGVSLAGAA
eukprot:363309-Chlamydomonas_euryale.AAC.26